MAFDPLPSDTVAGIGRNIALSAELMESARMYAWISFVIFTVNFKIYPIHGLEINI
mgnify:CR=1 FL=1